MEAEIHKYNSDLMKKWDKKRRFDEIEQKYNVRLCTVYEMCQWLMSNDRCEDCTVGLTVLHEDVTVSCLRLVRAHECLELHSNMKALWYIDVMYVSSRSYVYLNSLPNVFKFTFKKMLSMTLQDFRQHNDDTTTEYKIHINESESIMGTKFEDLKMMATLLICARHDVAKVFHIRPPIQDFCDDIVVNFDNIRTTRRNYYKDYIMPRTVFDDDNDESEKEDDEDDYDSN